MPSPQKYHLRIALVPNNAIEGVTLMNRKAVRDEVRRAQLTGEDANFEFINEDDTRVYVDVKSPDIQIVMHQEWRRPLPQPQIAVPNGVPRPTLSK